MPGSEGADDVVVDGRRGGPAGPRRRPPGARLLQHPRRLGRPGAARVPGVGAGAGRLGPPGRAARAGRRGAAAGDPRRPRRAGIGPAAGRRAAGGAVRVRAAPRHPRRLGARRRGGGGGPGGVDAGARPGGRRGPLAPRTAGRAGGAGPRRRHGEPARPAGARGRGERGGPADVVPRRLRRGVPRRGLRVAVRRPAAPPAVVLDGRLRQPRQGPRVRGPAPRVTGVATDRRRTDEWADGRARAVPAGPDAFTKW